MNSIFLYAVLLCGLGIPPLVTSQSCPEDWDLFEGRCYRYIPGSLSIWDSAQGACAAFGGNLASISTLSQSEHIYDMMLQHNPLPQLEYYWIGMFKDEAGSSYKWVDGSPIVYTSWAPGQPSHSNGEHHCVQVMVDDEQLWDKMWDDTDCSTMNGAVCIIEPVKECPSDDWDLYVDNCYRFFPDLLTTVDNAEQICREEGAHLASIHSETESLYIHSQMHASTSLPSLEVYWIGLTRPGDDDWNWSWYDGSPFDYERWDWDEPANQEGDQYCTRVGVPGDPNTGDRYWDDEPCRGPNGFTCKVPKGVNRENGKDVAVKEYHQVEVVGNASEDSMNSDGLSTGATAGIVLGGLVALVCVGTIVFMMMYRRKKMAPHTPQTPPVISVDMADNHI